MEIADKFANEADLGSEGERLESALTSRFSATLNGLVKQGLVRQSGASEDGTLPLGDQPLVGRFAL